MYFGDTTLIRNALRRRVIYWEGIARNVEYLGLPSDIKVFLGQWYALYAGERPRLSSHFEYQGGRATHSGLASSDDADREMMDDWNCDGMFESLSLNDVDETPSRGRDRATRGLSWTSTHPSITAYSPSFSLPESDTLYADFPAYLSPSSRVIL